VHVEISTTCGFSNLQLEGGKLSISNEQVLHAVE
jgi:hypothetical protein